MTYPITFTLFQVLVCIIIALLVGAFFGRKIEQQARQFFRPGVGELMHRESAKIGAQVLRSMGLSGARLIGNEEEGRLRRFFRDLKTRKPRPITTPEYRMPLKRN